MFRNFVAYVAVTRVRRGSDIRVLFFSDGKRGTNAKVLDGGLDHLKKLKRPAYFDDWLAAYDHDGKWSSKELLKKADADKNRAMKLLKRNKALTRYPMKVLKPIAKALGLQIENAPGKTYPRKEQFVTAIYPVWSNLQNSKTGDVTSSPSVGASPKVRTPAGSRKATRTSIFSTPATQKKRPRYVESRGGLFGSKHVKVEKAAFEDAPRVKQIRLVGRRVMMEAAAFGGNTEECYQGMVICKTRFRQRGSENKISGFKVKWHTGDIDCWYDLAHDHQQRLRKRVSVVMIMHYLCM